MSLYERAVVPYLLELGCAIDELHPARQKAVAQASGTLLEIGFGSGLNLPFLPSSVERVLAVDPSERARKIGKKRIAQAPCPIEFIGIDAQVIEADDASADCALSTFTLCSIPDAVRALREVRRILKPGGKLHFLEHGGAPDLGVQRWQARLEPLQKAVFGGCHLTRPIATLVENSGFTIESLEQAYLPGMPKTHAYLYAGTASA